MNRGRLMQVRLGYRLRTWLLMLLMLAAVPLVGGVLAGMTGALVSLGVVVALIAVAPRVSVRRLLHGRGVRELEPWEAPRLFALFDQLAARAGLGRAPRLMVRPGHLPEAFAAGEGEGSVIVVNDALLRQLEPREVAGVLAHELVHVQSGDLTLTRAASVLFSLTRSLASVGWITLFLTLPLVAFGVSPFPWTGALVIAVAPTLAGAAFLALSRVRELEADAGAAELTGDPEALASALTKIDSIHRRPLGLLPFGARLVEPPVWLRTHPPTAERVARLRGLSTRRPPLPPAGPRSLRSPRRAGHPGSPFVRVYRV